MAATSGLEGRTVIFVASGSDLNKSPLYETFKIEYGLDMVLLESAGNMLATRLHDWEVVTHAPVDLTPRASLVSDCVMIIEEAMQKMGKTAEDVDGIVTFWDDAVALTARLATHFGLISSPPSSIDICHDKYATRQALKEAGLPCPGYSFVTPESNIEDVVKEFDFPLVLKPVQGATSIGVFVCQDLENLTQSLKKGVDVLNDVYASNELMGLVFDDSPKSCTKKQTELLSFVVEEYIDGPEVDIDMIVQAGRVIYAKVSDDWEPVEPWRTETGVNYPSRLPETMQGELIAAATRVVLAFGITDGVLHAEMKYSSKNGPTLIECNPRLGGGPCHYFHKELYGVDLALEHVLIACGVERTIAPQLPDAWGVGLLLYSDESGTIAEDVASTPEYLACRQAQYVDHLLMLNKAGDVLNGWNGSMFPSHAGLLMAKIPKSEMGAGAACDYTKTLRSKALAAIKFVDP